MFLDRDGVLNRALVRDGKPFSPATLADFEILPGAAEAVARLRRAGLLAIVVTNQPDVSTGRMRREVVDAMHARLRATIPLDDLKMCTCRAGSGCDRRKPEPGMLLEAAREWGIDLAASFLVGDRWRDVDAGKAAGCRTVFIDHGYGEALSAEPDLIVRHIGEAADAILAWLHADLLARSRASSPPRGEGAPEAAAGGEAAESGPARRPKALGRRTGSVSEKAGLPARSRFGVGREP